MFRTLQRRSGLIFLKSREKYWTGLKEIYKKDRANFTEIERIYQVDHSVRGDFCSAYRSLEDFSLIEKQNLFKRLTSTGLLLWNSVKKNRTELVKDEMKVLDWSYRGLQKSAGNVKKLFNILEA